ncbi:MAG TPA: acetate kinase, partial [Candidatus Nanoarchaeia archaeon]|nr:acetate kinase [Candidatus Nanoarchaeia archaeon]
IACFDTVFHETMPDIAKIYPIPSQISKKYSIERYGFHGLAHQYMMQKVLKKYNAKKIITCQLGNGISISAIRNGKCIDTSMGFTPLEGVMMGTRSGSIDPSLVAFISKKERITSERVIELLNKESGLKGIAGESDVRELLKRKDASAKLAIDMLCYQIRKQIGAYIMALDGLDVLVLGGGLAKNPDIVSKILQNECMADVKHMIVNTDEQAVMFEISKKL